MNASADPNELDRLNARLSQLMQQHAQLFDRLRDGQTEFRRLARSVWRMQEEEQRRIARELHDGVGQNLAALGHRLDNAIAALPPGATAVDELLQKARDLARATLADTRSLSRLLRPQILDDLGIEAALRWLIRSMGEESGLDICATLPQCLPQLNGDLSTLIFRVVQEALGNILKHAGARQATIMLDIDASRLRLMIADDGHGCDAAAALAAGAAGHSSGLGGMRDRVRLFDGQFRFESEPGHGSCVRINLPLATDSAGRMP
ncbi:MAG: sensor histidine kinase [Tahibacter sp.]